MAGLTGVVRISKRRGLIRFAMTSGTLAVTDAIVMAVFTTVGCGGVRRMVK